MFSYVYKIVSKQSNKIYIGSTTQTLNRRFIRHKSDYRLGKHKFGSFDILQFNDAEIILIEQYEDISKDDLLLYEQYYLDLYKDDLCNIKKAYLSKEERKQYLKDYYSSREYKDKYNSLLKQRRLEAKEFINRPQS